MTQEETYKQELDDMFDVFSILAGGNLVTLYHVKAKLTRYSVASVELFGLPGEYVKDGAHEWAEHVHPEDRKRYLDTMAAMFEGKTKSYDLTYRVRTKEGSYGLFRFVGGVLRNENGEIRQAGGISINEGLMENTDPITVLRNQYGFFSDLASVIEAKRKSVILMTGFDRLNQINEEHGYGFGNRVLQEIAWILRETLGQDGTIYRMEGAKFAFMTDRLSEEEVQELYEKIRRRLLGGIKLDEIRLNLAANGGIISTARTRMNERTVYDCLMRSYHESKHNKHGNPVVFDGSRSHSEKDSLEMLNEIRSSMVNDCEGFYLLYQPVIRLDGSPVGVEAFVRWRSDRYGEVLPMEFIPVLEQDFAFEELGFWVLRQAMLDGKKLIEAYPDFLMGVNVSAVQLEDDYFIESLTEIAEQTRFPLRNLCLELTKGCRLLDMEHLREKAERLQEKGVRFLVDDFGSGFSSYEFLRELSADFVKFDMSFVKNIEVSREDREALEYFCRLAGVYGPNICVKGVENERMRELLRDYPVRSMQGYVFTKPLGFQEIRERFFPDH